jgi:hypothetical protein
MEVLKGIPFQLGAIVSFYILACFFKKGFID